MKRPIRWRQAWRCRPEVDGYPWPLMSIATKTGDAGTTGLMYNRRVSKCHPRVDAYGSVDELNAALGLARASSTHDFIRDNLLLIQKDLVTLMGELATGVEDLDRYTRDGFHLVTPEFTAKLDALVKQIEAQKISFKGWATPGATLPSAALDMARTTCRRAERRVCALHEGGGLNNPEIIIYLNRLSDTLWLMARWEESQSGR
jgi:cob(I)alamin adenosyltransferase